MMDKKKILVIGELNVDLILNEIQGMPKLGEEILADQMDLVMGSSSAIFACNIASLGYHVSFAGLVGKDFFGNFILKELRDRGIDTSSVLSSPDFATGITVVMNYDQDRANVTHCGVMEHLTGRDIPVERFGEFDHLHFSSYFLQKEIQKDLTGLFQTAKQIGLTTSLDLQWDPENKWDFPYEQCLPFVDVFLPNEKEILSLAHTSDLDQALSKIHPYANMVVVKMGENGARAFYQGKTFHSEAFLHDSFVDAIGAGDSFNAGFLFKYVAGCPIEEAIEFGNLAGAVSTTSSGGTAAFKTYETFKSKAKNLFNYKI